MRHPSRLASAAPQPWLLACVLSSLGCAEILGVADFDDATTSGTTSSTGEGGATGGGAGAAGGPVGGGGAAGHTVEPTLLWAGQLRGAGDDEVWGHDLDPNGEVGLCGPFESDIVYDWNGTTGTPAQSAGLHDFYVLKLTADGQSKWLVHVSGAGDNTCSGLAFDSEARTHITGSILGTVDFLGTPLDAGSGRAAYLAVLDGNGGLWRASQFEPNGREEMFDIDVDPSSTHWTAGAFRGAATFGGTSIETSAASRAGLAASETYSGAKQLVGIGAGGSTDTEEQWSFAVHAPSAGSILVGGRNTGTLTAGSDQAVSASTEGNAFMAELDGTGSVTRLTGYDSPGLSQVHGFAAHPDGDVTVVGLFTSALTVDAAPPLEGYGDWDAFILQLTPSWTPRWSLALGRAGAQEARDVAVDDGGNIYVVVNYAGTIEIGGTSLTAQGDSDGLLVSYGPDGSHRFHLSMESSGEVFVSSVAFHSAFRRVSVAGYFQDSLTFHYDGTQLGEALTSSGDRDGFVATFDLTLIR